MQFLSTIDNILYNKIAMRSPYHTGQTTSSYWLRFVGRHLSVLLFLGLAGACMLSVYWYFSPATGSVEAIGPTAEIGGLTASITKPAASRPVLQRLAQSPGPVRVGIIIGHEGFDSGAVCADGLKEVQVNRNIGHQVAAYLEVAGITTDLLAEYDPRLTGYSASALISIHADSCEYVNETATGFKISGSPYTDSSRLSICVEQAYKQATQLPYHPHSITPDMTDYHAFRKLAPGTQAIIIEVGFLNLDRAILTEYSEKPVAGLVNGVLCFMEQRR
jgi:N-acetylmuramoyl-L-alanine amidase